MPRGGLGAWSGGTVLSPCGLHRARKLPVIRHVGVRKWEIFRHGGVPDTLGVLPHKGLWHSRAAVKGSRAISLRCALGRQTEITYTGTASTDERYRCSLSPQAWAARVLQPPWTSGAAGCTASCGHATHQEPRSQFGLAGAWAWGIADPQAFAPGLAALGQWGWQQQGKAMQKSALRCLPVCLTCSCQQLQVCRQGDVHEELLQFYMADQPRLQPTPQAADQGIGPRVPCDLGAGSVGPVPYTQHDGHSHIIPCFQFPHHGRMCSKALSASAVSVSSCLRAARVSESAPIYIYMYMYTWLPVPCLGGRPGLMLGTYTRIPVQAAPIGACAG